MTMVKAPVDPNDPLRRQLLGQLAPTSGLRAPASPDLTSPSATPDPLALNPQKAASGAVAPSAEPGKGLQPSPLGQMEPGKFGTSVPVPEPGKQPPLGPGVPVPKPPVQAIGPGVPVPKPPGATDDFSTGPWDANRVRAYFASRGVTPNDTSPDYWAKQWQDWGQKDPAYFMQRLAAADEFGGGGGQGGGLQVPGSEIDPTIRQYLLQLLQSTSQPVTAHDPGIESIMDAARLQSGRGQEQERKMLAERLYAQGDLGSNSLNQGIQQSSERNAVGLAGIQANAMSGEIEQRRSALINALNIANAVGARQEAAQIQMALAQLQQGQFEDNLAYQYAALLAHMNQASTTAGGGI